MNIAVVDDEDATREQIGGFIKNGIPVLYKQFCHGGRTACGRKEI